MNRSKEPQVKNIKKIKQAGHKEAGPQEAKSAKGEKSSPRPISFARPCIPVDGN